MEGRLNLGSQCLPISRLCVHDARVTPLGQFRAHYSAPLLSLWSERDYDRPSPRCRAVKSNCDHATPHSYCRRRRRWRFLCPNWPMEMEPTPGINFCFPRSAPLINYGRHACSLSLYNKDAPSFVLDAASGDGCTSSIKRVTAPILLLHRRS